MIVERMRSSRGGQIAGQKRKSGLRKVACEDLNSRTRQRRTVGEEMGKQRARKERDG
jgi:hypothetical protein